MDDEHCRLRVSKLTTFKMARLAIVGLVAAAHLAHVHAGGLSVAVYNNTALAGLPVHNTTVSDMSEALAVLKPWQSMVLQGQLTASQWILFSVTNDAGFVRLFSKSRQKLRFEQCLHPASTSECTAQRV